jgi:hypothetical protein
MRVQHCVGLAGLLHFRRRSAPRLDITLQNCLTSLISVLFECHPYALLARQSAPATISSPALPPHASVVFEASFDSVEDMHDMQYPQSTRDAFNRLIEVSEFVYFRLAMPQLTPDTPAGGALPTAAFLS